MRIALDAQGGKAGPRPVLDAVLRFAGETGAEFLLCGPADPLRRGLAAMGVSPADGRFRVVDAPDLADPDEDPASTRERPLSPVMVAAERLARGEADALLATGNPGAAVVASLWHNKRLSGVLRPAVAKTLPTLAGSVVLLDCGAAPDCKPWHLLQFAMMGCAFARASGVAKPRFGLLGMGRRWGPGSESAREALALLKHSGPNFVGLVKGEALAAGEVDVAVCDGTTGSVCSGVLEGAGALAGSRVMSAAERESFPGLRRRLLEPALAAAAKEFRSGCAPLLGVDGVVLIARGDEGAQELLAGLAKAALMVERGLKERIREGLEGSRARLDLAGAME